ncbi:hypothetical protein DSL72_006854 [Monilinia vaccinii-corymbosi]|uniref:Uncharacterized protein n=1 Tax=Monilinia vaccinii-corymbosi TaxID=61207 RepID=A0A8A3PK52_9HELO|nr:hypothetical protein DSL72_006854 [Monilinia vaccinii-corymbosi]
MTLIIRKSKVITVFPPLPTLKKHATAGNTESLSRFKDFPQEIQLQIFRNALPDQMLIIFNFKLERKSPVANIALIGFRVYIAKFLGPLSLLGTCKTLDTSFLRDGEFEEIRIKPQVSDPSLLLNEDLQSDIPVLVSWRPSQRNYTYMRPARDIFMTDSDTLLQIYHHGGSINLERFTHIALRYNSSLPVLRDIVKILSLVQDQCPSLKRLSIWNDPCRILLVGERTPSSHARILDINDDMLKLKPRDHLGMIYPQSSKTFLFFQALYSKSRCLLEVLEKAYPIIAEKDGENKNSIQYWKS